ncbi:MAG: hypothetical protein AAF193_08670, partial [Bacteroidota bacterium]
FIKGGFTNEISSNSTKARIKIIDELTNVTVVNTDSDALNGNYLLSLPKAGLYKMEFQLSGSAIIHEAIFEVPALDHSAALKQEIRLVDQQGREQLVIENYFDEELNVDLAELAASSLRDKANLEVNATEELIAIAESKKDELKTDIAPHVAAGFKENETPDVIAEQLEEQASLNEEKASVYQNAANHSAQKAKELLMASKSKMDEAENMMSTAVAEGTDSDLGMLKEYQKLMLESRDLNVQAQNEMALSEFYSKLEQETNGIAQTQIDQSQTILSSQEDALLIEVLNEVQAQKRNAIDPREEQIEVLKKEMLEAEGLVAKEESRVLSLREDERRVTNSLARKKEALEKAKKKAMIASLKEEIAQEESELQYIQEQLARGIEKIDERSQVSASLNEQIQMIEGNIEDDFEAVEIQDVQSIQEELAANLHRNELMLLDDEETLTAISSETKRTRNDIVQLDAVKAAQLKSGVEFL